MNVDPDDGHGILPVAEFLLVELLAVLVRDLILAALPDGHHAVDDLVLDLGHPVLLGLAVLVLLAGVDIILLLHVHVDGPADVVGVLLHQVPEPVGIQIVGVALVVVVGPEMHDHIGAPGILLAFLDRVSVGALARPLPRLFLAVGLRPHGDPVGNQERGVEPDSELSDDVNVGLLLHLLLEIEGSAVCDDTEVGIHVLLGHADTVVRDGDGAGVLVV